MPKRKTRVRLRGSLVVAAVALAVAAALSIGTVVTLTSASGQARLEFAGTPHPTGAAHPFGHSQLSFSGSGDRVIPVTLPDGAEELAVATITNDGAGKFEVTGQNRTGSRTEQLVHTTSRYSGTVVFNRAKNCIERLHIVAAGPWSITLVPVRNVPEMQDGAVSEFGDQVVVYRGAAGSALVTGNGHGRFHLAGFGKSGNVAIHQRAPLSVEIRWPAGPSLIAVQFQGSWTIRVDTN